MRRDQLVSLSSLHLSSRYSQCGEPPLDFSCRASELPQNLFKPTDRGLTDFQRTWLPLGRDHCPSHAIKEILRFIGSTLEQLARRTCDACRISCLGKDRLLKGWFRARGRRRVGVDSHGQGLWLVPASIGSP